MNHIALDLGTKQSQICIRTPEGKILKEERLKTAHLGKFFISQKEKSLVLMEACAQSSKISEWAKQSGHKVVVVPGTLVKSLGVGSRGVKNDRKDAQVLSEVSTRIHIPGIHLKSERSRSRQKWICMRQGLVTTRTKLINQVKAYFREELKDVRCGISKTFASRVRKEMNNDIPWFLEGHLLAIESLSQSIIAMEEKMKADIKEDPDVIRLMTVPGVGLLTALSFFSSVDNVNRFADPHHLQSYIGLTPGERSSGLKRRTTSITKAGTSTLRWLLIQSAHCVLRTRPKDPMTLWALRIAERRGKQIAVVALARKLAGIMWAMLQNKTTYQPKKAANV